MPIVPQALDKERQTCSRKFPEYSWRRKTAAGRVQGTESVGPRPSGRLSPIAPTLASTHARSHTSLGHVGWDHSLGTDRWGRQRLNDAMTSGPILLLTASPWKDRAHASHHSRGTNYNHRLSPEAQSIRRSSPEAQSIHRRTTQSRRHHLSVLPKFSRQRGNLQLPKTNFLQVSRDNYMKLQEDLAQEVAVLRSSIDLHKYTDECGQKLNHLWRKSPAGRSSVHSPVHTPVVGKLSNAEHQWPSPPNSPLPRTLHTPQGVPGSFSQAAKVTSSMIRTIQNEIEKVEGLCHHKHLASPGQRLSGARADTRDDVKLEPAKLEDVVARMQTMSLANASEESFRPAGQTHLARSSWPCCYCGIWVDRDASLVNDRLEQCCGGVKTQVSCYCCICAFHKGDESAWCRHCEGQWHLLRKLEQSIVQMRKDGPLLSPFKMTPAHVDDFLDHASATRALVGPALQHRLDLIVVNTLLPHAAGIKALHTVIRDGGLRSECIDERGSVSVLTATAQLDLKVGSLERQAAIKEGKKPAEGSRRTIPEHLRLDSLASALSPLDGMLTSIDVSGNVHLTGLPLQELIAFKSLTAFECARCPRLLTPPPSVAVQGGSRVLTFVKSVIREGVPNRMMEMIVLGDRNSGKTCIIKALSRDISDTWDLGDEAFGLKFAMQELGSERAHKVAATQTLTDRAVYVLVWQVVNRKGAAYEQLSDMISTWMDLLHSHVSHTHVVLAVTHVDTLPEDEVDAQVKLVNKLFHAKAAQIQLEYGDSFAPFSVWNGGQSVRVNGLNGDGAGKLRSALISIAHKLPWWKEPLPDCYLKFRNEVAAECNFTQKTWLTWEKIAEVAERCSLKDEDLDIAILMLHESSALKYFGSAQGRNRLDVDLIDSTVFIDRRWIHDSFKGLFCTDRSVLYSFFTNANLDPEARNMWLRHLCRFATQGILHRDLIPFLWPSGSTPLSKEYWKKERPGQDFSMSERNFCKNTEDYNRVLLLLAGCKILHATSKSHFVVPLLFAESHFDRLDVRTYSLSDCTVVRTFFFNKLVPDFFERFLIALRQQYLHMDFNSVAASLYARGLKVQLFVHYKKGNHDGPAYLKCLTCTPKQMDQIEELLNKLLLLCPGSRLVRITHQERMLSIRAIEKPVDVRIICSPMVASSVALATYIKQTIEQIEASRERACKLSVDAGVAEINPGRMRVVLVVIDPWLKSSKKGQKQLRAAIAKDVAIIPLICPGYHLENFGLWWPENLQELLKDYVLFFDCRSMLSDGFKVLADSQEAQEHGTVPTFTVEEKYMTLSSGEKEDLEAMAAKERARWMRSVESQLLDRIYKCLDEWRGEVPMAFASKDLEDSIICPQCIEEQMAEPGVFSREQCRLKLRDWRVRQNKLRSEQMQAGTGQVFDRVYHEACIHDHRFDVENLLARSISYDAVPCPTCVRSQQFPPFSFSRETCLQHFRATTTSSDVCMDCPVCESAHRRSRIRVLDILPPQVYISFHEGVQEMIGAKTVMSTQELVQSMQTGIQRLSDFLCWFEAGRTTLGLYSGAQEDTRAGVEMHVGATMSSVMILFLSDAFCASNVCVREYLHAARSAKLIIPVLVPDKGPIFEGGPASGWTGAGGHDKRWWLHAMNCSSCRDPDSGKSFTWSALSLFPPIDLRDATDAARVQQATEHEIAKQLLSHLHRGSLGPGTVNDKYKALRKRSLLERLDSYSPSSAAGTDWDDLREAASKMFASLDTNNDGLVVETELAYWGVRGGVPVEEDYFTMRNRSNQEQAIVDAGLDFGPLDSSTTSELMAECDANKDGLISFQELWSVLIENVTL